MMQTATTNAGTLRLLALVHGSEQAPYVRFLAWAGQPTTAVINEDDVGSELTESSIELGDDDMDPLPTTPTEPGLWLMTWDWKMVPCEEQWGEDEDEPEMTAKYAAECTWRRPSMNDLSEMGMLG